MEWIEEKKLSSNMFESRNGLLHASHKGRDYYTADEEKWETTAQTKGVLIYLSLQSESCINNLRCSFLFFLSCLTARAFFFLLIYFQLFAGNLYLHR